MTDTKTYSIGYGGHYTKIFRSTPGKAFVIAEAIGVKFGLKGQMPPEEIFPSCLFKNLQESFIDQDLGEIDLYETSP